MADESKIVPDTATTRSDTMGNDLVPVSQTTGLATVPDTATATAVATAPPINTMVEAEVLTPEEAQAVDATAKELMANFDDFNYRNTYGAKAQEEVAAFDDDIFGHTRVYQLGADTRQMIGSFRNHMEKFRSVEKRGPGLGAKIIGEARWWTRQFEQIDTFVGEVKNQFRRQINELTVQMNVNGTALDINMRSRRALIVYILAAKQTLKWAREVKLAELQAQADKTKALGDVEAARDFARYCDEFELHIGRLDSSLYITYIRKPEIDLQRASQEMSISLCFAILTQAIPVWVEDMRIGMNNRTILQTAAVAEEFQDMLNTMFLSTMDRLGEASAAAIRVAGRGTIDTSTLIKGTDKLLAVLANADTALQAEIAKARENEKLRAANTARISQFLSHAGSSKTPAIAASAS